MVLVYSRLLIIHTKDIFAFLNDFTIENRPGLKVLIDKWLLHQPLFRGKYFKNISIKALTKLLMIKDPIIQTLMVIAFDPSHSNASVEVKADFKILSVLIRCLNNEILQEKMKNSRNDFNALEGGVSIGQGDDNQDQEINYEDNQEIKENDTEKLDIDIAEFSNMKEDDAEVNAKLGFVGKVGLGSVEVGSEIYLSEMLVFDYNEAEGEDEENIEEDLNFLKDLEYDFVLKDFLYDFLKDFYLKNVEYISNCLRSLPKKDVEIFKSFGFK